MASRAMHHYLDSHIRAAASPSSSICCSELWARAHTTFSSTSSAFRENLRVRVHTYAHINLYSKEHGYSYKYVLRLQADASKIYCLSEGTLYR